MANHEGFSTNMALLFDRTNYSFWSIRLQKYLMALGFDIWEPVMTGSTTPTSSPKYVVGKESRENSAKTMNVVLCGLSES
jgi:hypothetical protein